jgi:aspartyl-tRNA(Asn)/glutamyl-tRNA(Gln) amidotransferase subunit A
MCLGAVGTQTGGSIIRPASYCGVAGLKPTAGAVSLEGVVPISPHLDHAGPLARCADDLARLFLGMAEPTAVEASVRELQAHAPAGATGHASDPGASCPWPVLPTELAATPVIRVVEAPFLAAASPDVQSATRRAIERLSLGPAENVLPADWLGTVLRHHRRIMAYDAARVHQRAYGEAPHCFGPHIAGLIETGLALPRAEYEEALAHQQACRQSCLQLFPDSTLLLLPATNTAAPDRLDTTGDPAFNSPWSYTGLPAVTIPCGLSADGMPCGLQLLGPPHSELRLLRAAVWCEEQLGFRQQPPGA